MILTLLLRFWKPLALLLVIAAAILWYRHGLSESFQRGHTAGYAKAEAENAAALRDWQIAYDRKVKADADRLRKAQDQYTTDLARLNALRSKPVPLVVCRPATRDPRDVPADHGLHEDRPSGSGALPRRTPESFDPTPALEAIATEADNLLASCRRLHQEVHGVPSTLASRIPPH